MEESNSLHTTLEDVLAGPPVDWIHLNPRDYTELKKHVHEADTVDQIGGVRVSANASVPVGCIVVVETQGNIRVLSPQA